MRDPEVVRREMEERNEHILSVAYNVFVEKRIEAVSMQMIADAAGVGVATLFRYYASKTDLVITVCAKKWKDYLSSMVSSRPKEMIKDLPAIDRLSYTLDMYIEIYRTNKAILSFNDNFNHYINHEHVGDEKLVNYRMALEPMTTRFHWLYEKAQEDGTVRTDIPEDELLRVTLHTMMSACIHYAGGFIWGAESKNRDYTEELTRLKEMILSYVSSEK